MVNVIANLNSQLHGWLGNVFSFTVTTFPLSVAQLWCFATMLYLSCTCCSCLHRFFFLQQGTLPTQVQYTDMCVWYVCAERRGREGATVVSRSQPICQ